MIHFFDNVVAVKTSRHLIYKPCSTFDLSFNLCYNIGRVKPATLMKLCTFNCVLWIISFIAKMQIFPGGYVLLRTRSSSNYEQNIINELHLLSTTNVLGQ